MILLLFLLSIGIAVSVICFNYAGTVVVQMAQYDLQIDLRILMLYIGLASAGLLILHSLFLKIFSLPRSIYKFMHDAFEQRQRSNFIRGFAYAQYELYDKALRYFTGLPNTDVLAKFMQGKVLEKMGKPEDAHTLFIELHALDKRLGIRGLIDTQNQEESLLYLKQALVFFPESPLLHRLLLVNQWSVFVRKDSLDGFVDFSKSVPHPNRALYQSATYMLFAENAKARGLSPLGFLQKAWSYNYGNNAIALALIDAYREANMTRQAVKVAHKTLEHNPHPACVDILLKLKNVDNDVDAFNTAYALCESYLHDDAFLYYLSILAVRANLTGVARGYLKDIKTHGFRESLKEVLKHQETAASIVPFEMSFNCPHCQHALVEWKPVCPFCQGLTEIMDHHKSLS